jgi:uncharacterized protein (TIGR02679 family)
VISDAVRRHLADPGLAPVWGRLRERLERNGLQATGRTVLDLDPRAADLLSGIVGRRVLPGRRTLDLEGLDADLRSSAAECGLVEVLTELTGPLVDRVARGRERRDTWDEVWDGFFTAVDEPWAAPFVAELRRSAFVTRLGPTRAAEVLTHLRTLLARLDPTAPVGRAALAAEITGDAHGLDDGRTLTALTLRALSARDGAELPLTPDARRRVWDTVGVGSDEVSGTALVWNLHPPGRSAWAAMLGARRDLGLVTHLTSRELTRNPERLVDPGTVVWACENPQILQSAVARAASALVTCTSGNPSSAWWTLFQRMLADGAEVRYHGDFDWPGVRIAGRLIAAGAKPWRFGAVDYEASPAFLPLQGDPVPTSWDPALGRAMQARGLAVHEEALEPRLLADLAT